MRLPGRRGLVIWGLLLVVLLGAVTALFGGGEGPMRGSVLSRGSGGWLAARRYAEGRGVRVALLDRPLAAAASAGPLDGVLVVSFPWTSIALDAAEPIEEHLRQGGDVVLAYSGERNTMEWIVLEELGLSPEPARKLSLSPFAWRRSSREEWTLRPDPKLGAGVRPVRVWPPRFVPKLPKGAEVLFRTPGGDPAVAVVPRFQGRIWVLPVDALANSRLQEAGNADLLETLVRRLERRWTFDEYHHGLVAVRDPQTVAFGRVLDLVLIHLALLYGVAVFTLSRRFGPAWDEPPVVIGSVGSFLLGLGALHHRLRHHREAAALLLARTRDLSPDLAVPEDVARKAESGDPKDFVELAKTLARLKRGGIELERRPDA
ncbi:MAG TPA: DUF4350 domain-containing protein [Thermoanaerobaculia bacterium]|nr:DUF4350 domain-containing protein [Thermoanaerobaculia bacterium]